MNSKKMRFRDLLILVILVIISLLMISSKDTATEITEDRLIREIAPSGDLERVYIINGRLAKLFLKYDSLNKPQYRDIYRPYFFKSRGPHYLLTFDNPKEGVTRLIAAGRKLPGSVKYKIFMRNEPKSITRSLGWTLAALLLAGGIYFVFRRKKTQQLRASGAL